MSERLFHLALPAAWQAALASGRHAPASLATEGFVHLSFAHQLEGTLTAHFAAERELVLLELDAARVAGELRVERSRGGAPFPHLYRALVTADVVAQHQLVRDATGRFDLAAALAQ